MAKAKKTSTLKKRSNPRALPPDTTDDERAVVLAMRLYSGPRRGLQDLLGLSPEIMQCLPWLLSHLPRSSRERELLYAAIGRKLALKTPEFSRGTGAKKGSKHKDRKPETELTEASKNKRSQRANKELADRTISICGEELVLEDGVDVDLVKSALASIERQKR
jgi:hypothetical protein